MGTLGSCPGQGTAMCSFVRHFTLIVFLSTLVQVQMGTGKLNDVGVGVGNNSAMDKHPIQGGVEIL